MKLNRRTFIGGLAATAAAAGSWRFAIRRRRLPLHRPNIILFIADDMRFDAAGFAGNAIVKTPHMDALAAQGFVFDNSFVTTSICCTSRASIMSGQYALRHRVYDFSAPLPPASLQQSFPLQLRRAGYYTGFVGKWGIGGPAPVKEFDNWQGYGGQGNYFEKKSSIHLTDLETRQALDFLDRTPRDRPFLLVVAFKAPHVPLVPQPRFAHLYDGVTIPHPADDTPEGFAALPPLLQQSASREDYIKQMGSDALYQDHLRKYYALITGMDEAVGRIVARLSDMGAGDDSCIMLTSDNGMQMGSHCLSGKWCMLEASIRVPLVVRPARRFFSNFTPGRVQSLALNIDLSPTILAAAGESMPGSVEGADLAAVMRNPQAAWRSGFYYEHPEMDRFAIPGCEGYRGETWKYTRYFRKSDVNTCLFNLRDDPMEMKNLAPSLDYADRLGEMEKLAKAAKEALA